MAAKSKLRKELKAPDDFMSIATRVIEWMAAHRKELLIGLAAVVVVGAAIWTWRHFATRSSLQAADEFATAVEVYRRPVKGEPGAEQVDPKTKLFPNAKARAKAALEKLEPLVKDHGGSSQAHLAQLFIGNSLLTLGQPAKAVAAYQRFLSHSPDDPVLRAVALENLGYAHERQKQYAQALDAFKKMAQVPGQEARGLFHQARIHQAQGQAERAKKLLEEALAKAKKAKQDWFAREIESKIALLELAP